MHGMTSTKGHNLDPGKVKEGRKEELTFMDKRGIWTIKPTKECWEVTGAKPVSVRWVDTDELDGGRRMGSVSEV